MKKSEEHPILYMHISTIKGEAYRNKTIIPPLNTGPVGTTHQAVQRKDKRWEDKMEIWR